MCTNMSADYFISEDKSKLDVAVIHDFLCYRSYWAKGRSLENVKKAIDNSMCFGVYDASNTMLGYARVVSDKVAFAYLMDVFILEAHRGKGLSKMLVTYIMDHPDLQVRFWMLGTLDAHGLYEKFGFSQLDDIKRFMFKRDVNRF